MESRNESSEPAPKRRRVALACTACRIRKTRCNGGQPQCSLCQASALDCEYETSETTSNVILRKSSLRDWERRIEALEERVDRHDRLLASSAPSVNGDARQPAEQGSTHNGTQHAERDENIHLELSHLDEPALERPGTDGMAIHFNAENESGYFGPSSNIALTRQILQVLSCVCGLEDPETPSFEARARDKANGFIHASRAPSPSLKYDGKRSRSDRSPEESMLVLPKASKVQALLKTYFSNTGLLFPFINEEIFMQTYAEVQQSNFSSLRRSWLVLLNMILAMATNTGTAAPANERIPQAMVFYERAVLLCRDQMLRGTSLEIVQYLLLMSQFLQGSHHSVQTWTIHGLALKAAISIGLHTNSISSSFSAVESETRNRTWHACIMLDRSLCVTFGRPPAVGDYYDRLLLPVDWPSVNAQSSVPSDNRSLSTLFYAASIDLYRVTYKVIATVYGHNLESNPAMDDIGSISHVFELEQDIERWRSRTHPSLMLNTEQEQLQAGIREHPIALRFRVVLHLRTLSLQCLIYRHCLVETLKSWGTAGSTMLTAPSLIRMRQDTVQACVRRSQEIIELVHTLLCVEKEGAQVLGAWWFTTYFVFHAALIIVGGALAASPQDPLARELAAYDQASMAKAIAALQHVDAGNRIVASCVSYLRYLDRAMTTSKVAKDSAQNVSHEAPTEIWPSDRSSSFDHAAFPVNPLLSQHSMAYDGLTDFGDIFGSDLELAHFFASNNPL